MMAKRFPVHGSHQIALLAHFVPERRMECFRSAHIGADDYIREPAVPKYGNKIALSGGNGHRAIVRHRFDATIIGYFIQDDPLVT